MESDERREVSQSRRRERCTMDRDVTTRIFLAPVRKKPAPEIRLGSARPASSVGKACPPYFTARVCTRVYYEYPKYI